MHKVIVLSIIALTELRSNQSRVKMLIIKSNYQTCEISKSSTT